MRLLEALEGYLFIHWVKTLVLVEILLREILLLLILLPLLLLGREVVEAIIERLAINIRTVLIRLIELLVLIKSYVEVVLLTHALIIINY